MSYDLRAAFTPIAVTPRWIITDYLPTGTIMMIAGDPGIGKSSFNLAEGLHAALGRPFCGFATQQTRVLYFDQENSYADLTGYLQQLWIGLGRPAVEDVEPWFRIEHFQLGAGDWYAKMRAITTSWKPGLIYIDTATSALNIAEENDNAVASTACQRLRKIIAETESAPAIKILKHAKYQSGGDHKGGTRRTIRGAKAWLGAVDQTAYHIPASERAGRPRGGLRETLLVPDKSRAFGLSQNIRITPERIIGSPKGLILHGKAFDSDIDLLVQRGD